MRNEFWVLNISKTNVSLGDLRIVLRSGMYYNLLGPKHKYTLEELEKSAKSGSIYKKRNKIKVCDEKPKFQPIVSLKKSPYPIICRKRTVSKIEEPKYDELIFSDEKYADEMSELFKDLDG